MGLFISKLYTLLSEFGEADNSKVLMLGLDAAGKTTILYKVKLNETITSIPTIGFNVETVTPLKGVTFTVWDIGGQEKIRRLWEYYYTDTKGLLYIVDSSDHARVDEARKELFDILQSDLMSRVPVVVVANKQDMPNAMKPSNLADLMGLPNIKDRKWYIQGACAVTGEGIYEGIQELSRLIKESKH